MRACVPDIPLPFAHLFGEDRSPAAAASELDALISTQLAGFLSSELGPSADVEDLEKNFVATEIPHRGRPLADYLRFLFDEVVRHGVKTHSRRFIGHMTSRLPSYVDAIGRIVTALNQNVVKLETSNAFTPYERQALGMLHRLVYDCGQDFYARHVQDRDSTLGMMVSGGTLGNIAALWCARNRRLVSPMGGSVASDGVAAVLAELGYRRAVVIGTSLMHYSFEKGVDLLGLGRGALVRVPADTNGQVDPAGVERELLRRRDAGDLVLALVGVAGTTEMGTIDPLERLADLAAEHGCHYHVDAAWGGPVLFSSRHRGLLDGIARADSVTIDGHKQLYLPMGVGVVLFRDPEAAGAIEVAATYSARQGTRDLGRRTLEGSRPAMATYLHAAMHVVGCEGFEALIDQGLSLATYLADTVQGRPDFELLAEPQLNIVVFRYLPASVRAAVAEGRLTSADNELVNAANMRVQEVQRNRGWGFVSKTVLRCTRHRDLPVVALRSVLANPTTTRADIDEVLARIAELGAKV